MEHIQNDQTTNNTEFNTTSAENPKFKFDFANFESSINVSTDPTKPKIGSARMRKPSLAELITREEKSTTEIVEVNNTEDKINVEEDRGNAWLFRQIATHLKGFRLKGEPKEAANEWREVSEELLAQIPAPYASAFIRGIYRVTAKFVEDEDEGIVLGGTETLPVDLIVGSEEDPMFVIRFDIPAPSESELAEYAALTELRQPKTGSKNKSRIVVDLKQAARFFDRMMEKADAMISDNATVQGKTFAEVKANPLSRATFLEAVDANYKRKVLAAAMSKYSAKVQD